ncbi:MAG: VOC family protein [Acidimicrobiia bacterium]|nr:VOC family protein [Acidimicrobiia bacterium]MDH5292627.1 VOC family protein [Acidimicrobiia bacterium]
MPLDFQVTVDCADPHSLADWWARLLDWEVEPQDEAFIRRMIDEGHASETDTTTHNGQIVWREGAAIEAEVDGARRRMLFQLVPESKAVKNRIHLDVRFGEGDLVSLRTRLEAMGAVFVHQASQGPHSWITMTDPEGNEFCAT